MLTAMHRSPARCAQPVSLKLGFACDDFGYAIDLGMPIPSSSQFSLDPVVKRECIWGGAMLRPSTLLVDRQGAQIARTASGDWQTIPQPVASFDSMMTEFADPTGAPEMIAVRERIRSWRFYDHFRTDAQAPARQSHIGTHTPVLADDGADRLAALQTIREIGDGAALDAALDDAFPGASVEIDNPGGRGRFDVLMPAGCCGRSRRPSCRTARCATCCSAALLTPRPPALMVLNEPETSLHPDLLPALGRLIAQAAQRSQVLVVARGAARPATLEREAGCESLVLDKQLGATSFVDADTRPAAMEVAVTLTGRAAARASARSSHPGPDRPGWLNVSCL